MKARPTNRTGYTGGGDDPVFAYKDIWSISSPPPGWDANVSECTPPITMLLLKVTIIVIHINDWVEIKRL